MKRKQRYLARLDEVTITREGEHAVIAYQEDGVPTTHLRIGPEIADMTDEAILEVFNETLRAQAQLAGEYKHVAVEVPLGSPQIEYHPGSDQWTPRGGVLRCLVSDDEDGDAVIVIDDQELPAREFVGCSEPTPVGACGLNSCPRTRFTAARPWKCGSRPDRDLHPRDRRWRGTAARRHQER